MASLPIDQSATEHVDSRVLRVAAVVFLGPLITQIDSTVVNVSLGGQLGGQFKSDRLASARVVIASCLVHEAV
jgi:hypothetical protein